MTSQLEPNLSQDFALPVLATVAWAMMTQAFGLVQIFAKINHPRKDDPNSRFDYTYERWRVADRTMMNSVEQHGVFLSLVWMHAVFVDAPMAGTLGLAAVAFRATYPILRGVMQVLMEISTHGYHVCMGTMCCNLVCSVLRGTLFVEALSLDQAARVLAAYLLWMVAPAIYGAPVGVLVGKLTAAPAGEKDKKDK